MENSFKIFDFLFLFGDILAAEIKLQRCEIDEGASQQRLKLKSLFLFSKIFHCLITMNILECQEFIFGNIRLLILSNVKILINIGFIKCIYLFVAIIE